MKSVVKYFRIDRREIYFLKFILEAYDGIAMFRTVDSDAGIVALHIAPGCEETVDDVVHDLKTDVLIEQC